MNRALWGLQILLGLFFVLASGAPKLFIPPESLPMPIPIPHALLLFIGVCEVLGGLALIVPGLLHRWVGLTPLAAAALTLLTICAAGYQLMANSPGNAVFALAFGALCAFIAYGRARLAPLKEKATA